VLLSRLRHLRAPPPQGGVSFVFEVHGASLVLQSLRCGLLLAQYFEEAAHDPNDPSISRAWPMVFAMFFFRVLGRSHSPGPAGRGLNGSFGGRLGWGRHFLRGGA